MDPVEAVGLVLAAGDSRRMGREKALLDLGHGPAWAWLAAKLHEAGCARVLVAIPPRLADRVCAAEPWLEVVEVEDRLRARGPIGSLAALCRRSPPARGWLVAPVDHPLVAVATLRALLAAEGELRVPVHAGRRGHPVWVGAGHGPAILAGPASLRELFRGAGVEVAEVPVDDPAVLANLDRPEDLPGA
ncbi:MAG: NTP transferase domain-containing protein [Planctomycetota bacterium]